jgi:hypothetical protein
LRLENETELELTLQPSPAQATPDEWYAEQQNNSELAKLKRISTTDYAPVGKYTVLGSEGWQARFYVIHQESTSLVKKQLNSR